jgi:carboxyl-terminal processing protease
MKIMSRLYNLVKMYFGHWEALPPDYDFDAVFDQMLEKALHTEDRREFTLQMMTLIASLQNGHSLYRDNAIQSEAAFGFRLNYLQHQWVVTQSAYTDLPVGAVVEKLDGQPTEDFFQEHQDIIHASSDYEARHDFSLLHMVLGDTVSLSLDDGRTLNLKRDATLDTPTETSGHWLETNKIAYVRIPRFTPSHFEERALELVEEFESAPTLIVDVRDNTGGSTPAQLIRYLLKQPARDVVSVTPLHIGIFQAYAQAARVFGDDMSVAWKTIADLSESYSQIGLYNPADIISPDEKPFEGEVLILTNGHTGSAAEDFAIPFKTSNQATIIGTRTNGSTGQPFVIQFNDDISMRVSTRRTYYPGGTPFEGVGVVPDIEVEPTIADLKAGRDTVLQAALDFVRRSSD